MDKRHIQDGMRCARMLWWTWHEPEAPELHPDLVARDHFLEGQAVTAAARAELPGREYEAGFEAEGVSIRADILEHSADGVGLIEVKASKSVATDHVDDVAIQVHVLRAAGERVASAQLMHLNPECRAPDLSNLFTRADLTARVERRLPIIARAIADARNTIAGPLPDIPIGPHCRRGKEDACAFVARCWKDVPQHHVSTLYYIGGKWEAFTARGFHTIDQLPEDVQLPKPETYRQVRAVKEQHRIIEPGLRTALARWRGPIAYLDFETIGTAIPVYPGSAAWEQVPAQFSVHHEAGSSHEWIADREPDPRPALAHALVEACRGAETIVAYYADFERGCLRQLQAAVPSLAGELAAIEARLVDALPVVRAHVYDPAFGGGFSLKKVQPALVPELTAYDDMAVREGQAASVLLKQLLGGHPEAGAERARVRGELLEYCGFDTFGLMRLVERLRELGSV